MYFYQVPSTAVFRFCLFYLFVFAVVASPNKLLKNRPASLQVGEDSCRNSEITSTPLLLYNRKNQQSNNGESQTAETPPEEPSVETPAAPPVAPAAETTTTSPSSAAAAAK